MAKRTKAVLIRGGVASRCVYKWCMTGTPILNRPIELYPILKAMIPEALIPYDSYEKFALRFCGAYYDGFRMVVNGSSNETELHMRLKQGGFMLRRKTRSIDSITG